MVMTLELSQQNKPLGDTTIDEKEEANGLATMKKQKFIQHYKGDTTVGSRFAHSLIAHAQGIADTGPKAIGEEDVGDL